MTGQPKYNTALYLRLSKDDGTMNESSSIQTQKEMLTRYCRENGFAISQIYIDDGWSGTNTMILSISLYTFTSKNLRCSVLE